MLRNTTLPLALAFALTLPAQIQIGENEMPHAGDALDRTRANANPLVDFATTGPDHEWDFTDLSAASEDLAAYQSVGSTNFIYAIAFADVFFNANRANHAKEGVDIPFNQLLPITNPYTFLYHSATVYRKVGFGVELSGIPVPLIFSSPDVIYELPLDYGDGSASNSGYEINIPTLAYYGYHQERTNDVDGWGTIATPAGSFDVLRVNTTIAGHDTINLDTLSLGFNIDRPLVHEYKWLAQDLRVPVLQINTTELFGTEIVTEIFYYDQPHTIVVAPPLAATLCPGSEFELAYEATGSYNPGGFFIPSNEFIAQLSDANGDFSDPTFLGQVTATVSGTITVTIPPNTPPGTGYRIRVNSNSPAYIGADNGFDITIDSTPPSAVISADGPTEFCGGGAVTLSAEPVAGTYQWQLNGADIDGADGAAFEAAASGDYTLAVTNACGNDVSEAITVAVADAPAYAFDQPSYLSCDGSPITITALDNSGQSDLTYEWTLNDVVLAGEDGASLLVAEAGSYALTVTNTVTGCSYTADAVEVAINQVGTPVVTADGPVAFCPGGSVNLSVAEVGGVSYQWSVDGVAIDGATGVELPVDTAGSYTVAGTSSGCSSASSEPVVVTIEAVPATPVITAPDGVAFCAGGSVTLDAGNDPDLTYQWSLNGNALDGETSSQLIASAPGDYAVAVSTGAGCSATSAITAVTENPLPDQPVITQVGDQLTASGTGTFQWLLGGNVIDGATGDTYLPTENGNYNVTITDANGCSSTSDAFAYISTGIVPVRGEGFVLYPNPTSGLVYLKAPTVMDGARISVLDATGRTVVDRSINSGNTTIDLRTQEAGLYFVRLLNGGVPTIVRLVVN
jgi:hypothetical protein